MIRGYPNFSSPFAPSALAEFYFRQNMVPVVHYSLHMVRFLEIGISFIPFFFQVLSSNHPMLDARRASRFYMWPSCFIQGNMDEASAQILITENDRRSRLAG